MTTALRATFLMTSLLMTHAVNADDTHRIVIERAPRVGDGMAIRATYADSQEVVASSDAGGETLREDARSINVEGYLAFTIVDPEANDYVFQLTPLAFDLSDAEGPRDLIETIGRDGVIVGTYSEADEGDARTTYTIDGAHVADDVKDALDHVLWGLLGDDLHLGATVERTVGERWPIESGILTNQLLVQGIEPKEITSYARFARRTPAGAQPASVVEFFLKILEAEAAASELASAPRMLDFDAEVTGWVTFPDDETHLPLESSRTMSMSAVFEVLRPDGATVEITSSGTTEANLTLTPLDEEAWDRAMLSSVEIIEDAAGRFALALRDHGWEFTGDTALAFQRSDPAMAFQLTAAPRPGPNVSTPIVATALRQRMRLSGWTVDVDDTEIIRTVAGQRLELIGRRRPDAFQLHWIAVDDDVIYHAVFEGATAERDLVVKHAETVLAGFIPGGLIDSFRAAGVSSGDDSD